MPLKVIFLTRIFFIQICELREALAAAREEAVKGVNGEKEARLAAETAVRQEMQAWRTESSETAASMADDLAAESRTRLKGFEELKELLR